MDGKRMMNEEIIEQEKDVREELEAEATNKLDENFWILAKLTRRRVRKKWDAVYGITGEEGVGKSTFGIQFGKATDNKFAFERNIIFNPDKEKIKKLILGLPKYSVVDVDEAIKILYKMQWYTEIQHMLNMIYALCRRENKISLLLMPRFKDFNEFFRNHRIKLWIHIVDRGVAVVFAKHWSPFIQDPWLMKENDRLVRESSKQKIAVPLSEKLKILRRSPNYVMEIAFPPLTKEEEDLFEELRVKSGIYEEGVGMTKWEKKWKERFIILADYLIRNKILTSSRIADIVEMGASNVREILHQWYKVKAKK